MNGGKAGAFVAAHKKELLLGGAGVAVAFGLHARSKGGSPATTAATTTSGAPMPSASGTGFDSSSTDVYNALQPQIETTQRQLGNTQSLLEKLLEQLKLTPVAKVIPLPAPKAKPPVKAKPKPKVPPRKVVPKNPAPRHVPPPRRVPPKAPHQPARRVYTVRKGDSLSTVATRLGVKGGWHALYTANRVTIGSNANLIKPGQRLVY